MLSIAKLSVGQRYRHLMDSFAVGDGRSQPGSALTRCYANLLLHQEGGRGVGLADMGDGVGILRGQR